MDRLSAYIDSGNGSGFRCFFWFSAILTLLIGGFFYASLRQLPHQEQVQTFLNTFPPVTIQNGQITAPTDTVWTSPANPDNLVFTIDTRSHQPADADRADGIYLLTTHVLFKASGSIQTLPWPDGTTVLTRQKLLDTFQETLVSATVLSAAIIFAILWLGMALTILLTRLLLWVLRRHTARNKISRATCVGWTAVILLNTGLLFAGYGFSVLMMILMAGIIATVGILYTL